MADKLKKDHSKANAVIIGILILLTLAGAGTAAYLYTQVESLKNNPETSKQASENRTKVVKDKVAKLISVPADETPTLATVTDKEKLKDQPFFKDAENGDVILIFPQAKKAVIYRESQNKLINVGPIAITSDVNAAQGTEQAKPSSDQ